MRNRFYIFYCCLFGLSLFSSCSHSVTINDEDASLLFHKTIKVLNEYTDSLNFINDSTSINRINLKCNELLSHIQYEYKPETYLKISESQNDSIIKCTESYLLKLNDAYIRAKRISESFDSIINE